VQRLAEDTAVVRVRAAAGEVGAGVAAVGGVEAVVAGEAEALVDVVHREERADVLVLAAGRVPPARALHAVGHVGGPLGAAAVAVDEVEVVRSDIGAAEVARLHAGKGLERADDAGLAGAGVVAEVARGAHAVGGGGGADGERRVGSGCVPRVRRGGAERGVAPETHRGASIGHEGSDGAGEARDVARVGLEVPRRARRAVLERGGVGARLEARAARAVVGVRRAEEERLARDRAPVARRLAGEGLEEVFGAQHAVVLVADGGEA